MVTYEGSRFVVNDLKLLMDTFHRVEFTGTWRRLFSRVKKHIIWGVLKSVTGMQVMGCISVLLLNSQPIKATNCCYLVSIFSLHLGLLLVPLK